MALDFFAGCVGGCAGILVGHPLDTIKVRLQTQDFRNPIYRGTFHCFQTILQTESVRGLYRGMSSPMGGVAFINAIVFGIYGNAQRQMKDPNSLSSHFIAGCTAGIAQSFVCSPMELAKIRMQVQKEAVYRGSLHCLAQVTREGGLRGMYRGLGLTMARDAPAMGVYFLSYEMLTRPFTTTGPLSTIQVMVAGGLAGAISWIATFPFDVLKSRFQMDGMYGPAKYNSVVDCFRQSVKTEGYSFILRGLASTLIRAFPVNAATFAGVTWVFKLARVSNTQAEESGYYIPSQYEEEGSDVMFQRRVSGEDVKGLKSVELWKNWENTALKRLFHWRKLMIYDIEGSYLLDHHDDNGLGKKLLSHDGNAVETKLMDPSQELLGSVSSEDEEPELESSGGHIQIECVDSIDRESLHDKSLFLSKSPVSIREGTLKEKYR